MKQSCQLVWPASRLAKTSAPFLTVGYNSCSFLSADGPEGTLTHLCAGICGPTAGCFSAANFFFFFFLLFSFWRHLAAYRILSFLTSDQTHTPHSRSVESLPMDRQGSPLDFSSLMSFLGIFSLHLLSLQYEILMPKICCIPTCVLYAYLCFKHKKSFCCHCFSHTLHPKEPVFTPVKILSSPLRTHVIN